MTIQISGQHMWRCPIIGIKELCEEIRLATSEELSNGLYWIDSDDDGDTSNAEQVFCDMNLDDGGWTSSRISVNSSSRFF